MASAALHLAWLTGLGPVQAPGQLAPAAHLDVRLRELPAVAAAEALPLSLKAAASEPAPPRTDTVASGPTSAAESVEVAPIIELPLEEVYFKSSELDEQPYPLSAVEPQFPPLARSNDHEGWVRLLLLIDESGRLRRVEVLETSSPGVFDDAAVAAFQGTAFAPGRRAGDAVKSRMVVKVEFKQEIIVPGRGEGR